MSLYTSIYQLASNYYWLMVNFVSSTLSSTFTSWNIPEANIMSFCYWTACALGLALSQHNPGLCLSGDLQVLDLPRKESKDESE